MKILHTSDWHLGKRLEDFSRLEEQQAVLHEICQIADKIKADAILVSGDLFDTFNPPSEAVDLLYKTLKKLTNGGRRPVIAIAGNHDSPDRIEAPDPLARECGIIFVGYPHSIVPEFELETGLKVINSDKGFVELQLPGITAPLRILSTPYANEYRLKTFLGIEDSEKELRKILQENWQNIADKYCDEKGVNILVSHLFMVKKGEPLPEEPEDEKPILHVGGAQAIYSENIPKQIQYTALGHLHRMHSVDTNPCPIYYSGSPFPYSFSEANQKKYVLDIEVTPGSKASVNQIELTQLKPLLRKRAIGVEDAINWLLENQNALVELILVTDTFLTAKERRKINKAHNNIVSIIPEVTNMEDLTGCPPSSINLSQSMQDLFSEYFLHEKGQDPNKEIMDLFNEILSEEEEK